MSIRTGRFKVPVNVTITVIQADKLIESARLRGDVITYDEHRIGKYRLYSAEIRKPGADYVHTELLLEMKTSRRHKDRLFV